MTQNWSSEQIDQFLEGFRTQFSNTVRDKEGVVRILKIGPEKNRGLNPEHHRSAIPVVTSKLHALQEFQMKHHAHMNNGQKVKFMKIYKELEAQLADHIDKSGDKS